MPSVSSIHQEIQQALLKIATAERKKSTLQFFKEPIQCYGVSNPDAKSIGTIYYQKIKQCDKAFIWEMAEALLASGWIEEGMIACQWVLKRKKEFAWEDRLVFERWIQLYVHNWAICDTFCNQSVGALIMQFPEATELLYSWTTSENLWVRRAAAVSLIVPAKRGSFETVIFDICNLLLTDTEPMVQKGYGWLLKVYSQRQLQKVYDYVMRYEDIMPRTAFRYAIEKMPGAMKDRAMGRG
jgi:3-methyladenine DNA glycosylase AlkD